MAAPGESSLANEPPEPVTVDSPITLGQFVKLAGLASTGGEAKQLVAAGMVRLNGEVDERRGHKLASGDVVEVRGQAREVAVRLPSSARG
jgi:ribosome-associated protein